MLNVSPADNLNKANEEKSRVEESKNSSIVVPFDLEELTRPLEQTIEITPPSSVESCIINDRKLIFVGQLPHSDDEEMRALSRWTTFVTPTLALNMPRHAPQVSGYMLWQWNEQTKNFFSYLNASDLQKISDIFKEPATSFSDQESLYPRLHLDQLNTLDSAIRKKGGFSVTGYSMSHEVIVRLLGLCFLSVEYPPKADAYAPRALRIINHKQVQQTMVAATTCLFFNVLYASVAYAYLQVHHSNGDAFNNFINKNFEWILASFGGIFALMLFALNSGCFNKDKVLTALNRGRLIAQSLISTSQNWYNYMPIVFPGLSRNISVFNYGYFSMLFLGFVLGYSDDEKLTTAQVMNIRWSPTLLVVYYALQQAMVIATFWSASFFIIINNYVFLFNNPADDDYYVMLEELEFDLSLVLYTVFSFTFIFNLARHPALPIYINRPANYIANIMKALGLGLLDSTAIMYPLQDLLSIILGNSIYPQDTLKIGLLYSTHNTVMLFTLIRALENTPDLPLLVVEKNYPEDENLPHLVVDVCMNPVESFSNFFERIAEGINSIKTRLPFFENFTRVTPANSVHRLSA